MDGASLSTQAETIRRLRASGRLLLAALILSACQGVEKGREPDEEQLLRGANCFLVATINNWRVIDSRTLVVWSPSRSRPYKVTLFSDCHGMRFAEAMAFRSRGSNRICGDPGDEIIFRERRCGISEVRALSPAELQILLDEDVREDTGKLPETD